MKHLCHAQDCIKAVPPKMFMCLKHWKMLPRSFQDDIWKNYKVGQEIRKDPTSDYLKATTRAIAFVIMKEKGLTTEQMIKTLESMRTK